MLRTPAPATWMPAFAGMTIIHPRRTLLHLPVHRHRPNAVPGSLPARTAPTAIFNAKKRPNSPTRFP